MYAVVKVGSRIFTSACATKRNVLVCACAEGASTAHVAVSASTANDRTKAKRVIEATPADSSAIVASAALRSDRGLPGAVTVAWRGRPGNTGTAAALPPR